MSSSQMNLRSPRPHTRSSAASRVLTVVAFAWLATSPLFGSAGELDCTFDGDGRKVQSFSSGTDQADDIDVLADGRIVTLTSDEDSTPTGDVRFSRFLADGSLDTTFGGGTGTVVVTVPGVTFGDFAFVSNTLHFARDSAGRYLVVGSAVVGTDRKVFVGRFTSAGALDATFGGGTGFTTFDWAPATAGSSVAFDAGNAIAVDASNRPIVAGRVDGNGPVFNPSDANFAFARLTTAGVLDATFGTGGITIVSSPGTTTDDTLRDMKLDPSGRIVAVGDADPNLTNARDAMIVRLTSAGVPDATFDGDGVLLLDLTQTGASDTSGDDVAQELAFTSDSPAKIVIAGFAPQTLAIARLTDGGALDLSFGGDGIVNYDFEAGSQNVLEHLFVQPDGKLLVTGWIPFDFSVMRLDTSGNLDPTWAGDGRQTVNILNLDRAYAAALMADGRVVLAGGTGNDTDMALARFLGDSSTVTGSTTAITSDLPDPSVAAQAFTVAISVQPTSGATAPTGTVTVGDGAQSTSCALVPPGSGTTSTASCSLALSTLGNRNLTASFPGNAGAICPSTSVAAPHQVVANASTTTILSDTPDPSVVGQPVPVTFSVTALAGTPTGSVLVSDGATSCMATVAAGTCTFSFGTPGPLTLTATYLGDGTVPGSTSAPEPHTVNVAATTTSIIGDAPDPSVVGESVTVFYSVTVPPPGNGTPTGTVTVSDGTDSCSASVAAGQCSLALTTPGARNLVATYGGDTKFAGSASAPEGHTIDLAATTTVITSDAPDASVVGQNVTVQYTVTVNGPGSGTPGGTVTVSDSVDSCSASVAAGQCSLTLTTAGARNLVATYAGDTSFATSASAAEAHTVDLAATTTVITSDAPDASVGGQSVTVQYAVTVNGPGSGTPGGTVTVSDGTDACSASVAAGQCSLTLTTPGARNLVATYGGDTSFAGSASVAEGHTVDLAATTTAITSDAPDASSVGQSVTVQYSVTADAPGSGTPTGAVTVSDGADSCSATVAAGQCSLALTTVGARTLTASYAGSPSFSGSTGSTPHQVVAGASTTTVVGSTPDPSVTGEPVTVSFTVTSGSATPTGSVTVSDGNGGTCTGPLVSGSGSCSFAPATAGVLTLTADYPGDASVAASQGTAPHTVNPAPTTLVLQGIAPEPSAPGQNAAVAFALTVVAPGAGIPTGTVTVTSGAESCSAPVADGVCSIAWPASGNYSVTASYAGDANFAPSAAATPISHGVASVTEVPTLGEWGLAALAAALAGAASRRIKRARRSS